MDFYSLKRRDLQALCKKNNIPANITNAAMADALNSLETVEGIEEFLVQLENGGSESPERSVITSPNVPRTSTRQKPSKEGFECSKLAMRTRCGTRNAAVEGTGTRKTPATRTTRRKATQEASNQEKTEKDLQAKFEENLEQSEGSENKSEPTETLEEVSGVSVDLALDNNDGEEIVVLDDDKENMGKDHVVNEDLEESIEMSNSRQKIDFHSLGRKDLQHLCKKNKIPANMTNAAMADALESLDIIEGLEEFLKGYDPSAIKSPETSCMTSSRVHQVRTDRKTTARKSTRAGSALGKSLAKKIEDLNTEDKVCLVSVNTDEAGQSVDKNLQSHLEASMKESEFVELIPENHNTINGEWKSVSEEVSNEHETLAYVLETGKKLLDETVENECQGGHNQNTGTEMCDNTAEFESNLAMKPDAKLEDDAAENAGGNKEVEVNNIEESYIADITNTDADDPNVDNGLTLETPEAETEALDECIEFVNKSGNTEMLESDTNSSDEPDDVKRLMQEATSIGIEGCGQSCDLSDAVEVANTEGSEGLLNTDNSKQLGDFVNEDVSIEEDSNFAENISILVKNEMDPKPAANSVIEEEEEEEEVSSSKISLESEHNNCQHESEKLVKGVSDATVSLCPAEKLEGNSTEDQLSEELVPELAAQASQLPPKAKGTPLCHKSLRKLKRMLREKLQQSDLLAKKMEILTLEENKVRVDSNDSDVQLDEQVKEHLTEGIEEVEEMSDGLNLTAVSGLDSLASELTSTHNSSEEDRDEELNDGLQLKVTNVAQGGDVLSADEIDSFGVNIIECNEICEDSVTGQIDVESVQSDCSTALNQPGGSEADTISFRSQFTPRKAQKPLVYTPTKSSSKTPVSAGRTNRVLDANKENIDSASKIEAGKIKIAVTPVMSMGKLKKEVKVLLQQSEKKRPALQSRSDNQCPLASP